MEVKDWTVSSQVVVSMLLVQVFATVMQLLSKVILRNGTFVFALMAYRHLVASIFVAPFAFFLERELKDKLSLVVFCWLFVNSLTGILLPMSLFYYGLRDTSATYASNFLNLIPIVTFVFSIILRFEKLWLDTRAGKIKSLGAIICVGGVLTISLYDGKSFELFHHCYHHNHVDVHVSNAHWARGSLMLVGSCLSIATWYLLQVKLNRIFPLKYWATTLTCTIASIQSAIIGLCIDRSKNTWTLGWNLELITIFYSGAFATAATFCLITWAVAKNGPSYPSMFNPLTVIFVAILEAFIFCSKLSIGTQRNLAIKSTKGHEFESSFPWIPCSFEFQGVGHKHFGLMGTVLIIIGLYSFLWGKKKEMSMHLPQQNAPKAIEATATNEIGDQEESKLQLGTKLVRIVSK